MRSNLCWTHFELVMYIVARRASRFNPKY